MYSYSRRASRTDKNPEGFNDDKFEGHLLYKGGTIPLIFGNANNRTFPN